MIGMDFSQLLQSNQVEKLQAFIANLPPKQLAKLALELDAARIRGTADIPYDMIMQYLRPGLLEAKPGRVLTPLRIVCIPWEDMITAADPEIKKPTLIARGSIAPMWSLLTEEGGNPLTDLIKRIEDARDVENMMLVDALSLDLWEMAYDLLSPLAQKAVNNPDTGRTLSKRMGGARRVEDLVEMTHIWKIAPALEKLKHKLPPKPIGVLNDDGVGEVKKTYEFLSNAGVGGEQWVIIAIMRRLLREAEILKVVRALSRDGSDTLASLTDLVAVGDVVIQQVEDYVTLAEELAEDPLSDEKVMGLAKEYAASFSQVTSNLDIKKEGVWGKRMLESRRRMAQAVEQSILNHGGNKIMDALPKRKKKLGKGKTEVADLKSDVDLNSYREAEKRARAIRDCRRISQNLGLKSKSDSVMKDLEGDLEHYGDNMIEEMKKIPADKIPTGKRHLIMTAYLMEVLMGTEKADLFRRRGLAAVPN